MKNSTSSFLFLLLLALFSVAALVSAADGSTATRKALGGGGRLGGWRPINDTSDPHVLDLGKFAVAEHNRLLAAAAGSSSSSSVLSFVRVVKGESQVVSGVNYRLVLEAKDHGGRARTYEAVVLEKAWLSSRKLTSFKPL